ncbi:rRNA methyltransferase 3, mitochondrial-like isoform X1 [Octopus vulgaris]|uniref:rRNA methyltransferase 3, mitochondrial-like isoform X1 n=1 Tax=Octopus vulgaris TaxID=6645 RepID=A0AA36AUN5_OCTVU|nr:rRNA methyltransferase 3, mitochondrial-like isoform X1 [Octopus vulgaris]
MAVFLRTMLFIGTRSRPQACLCKGKHSFGVHRPMVNKISPEEEKKKILTKKGFLQPKINKVKGSKFNTRKDKIVGTQENTLVFHSEKLSSEDPRFGSQINIAKSRKTRYKTGKIFLEGKRLIMDALESGAECSVMYVTSEVEPFSLPAHLVGKFPIYKVQYKHLKLWSDVVTPSGIAAIFKMPSTGESLVTQTKTIPLTIILDNIRDSGNMGTLIRSAAAVGCSKVLASVGCVDIWEPKVLRSACGSHFRVPIINNISWGSMSNYLGKEPQVLLASTLSSETPQLHPVYSFEDIDQLIKQSESDESIDDDSVANESDKTQENKIDLSVEEEMYHKVPLSHNVYHRVSYTGKEIVLVVGNEAHGLSADAKKFAFKHYGQYVSIPLANGVDSLNNVVAASIFMFEIQKQMNSSRQV